MKTKLMAALFSASLFGAGTASAKTENNYVLNSHNWNYKTITNETGFFSGENLMISGDIQAESVNWTLIWNKLIPGVGNVLTIAYIINEYGIPAFVYIGAQLDESQITNTCDIFYEYQDYLDGEMSDYDEEGYKDSSDFKGHEELSGDEYYELRDFCYDKRPRS